MNENKKKNWDEYSKVHDSFLHVNNELSKIRHTIRIA